MVHGDTGLVEGGTDWYMVVSMGLSHSIWRRKINGDTMRVEEMATQGEEST